MMINNIQTMRVSLDEARLYLAELDLNYIVEAMCSPNYALPRWTLADARHCTTIYKNFLYLQKKFLPQSLVPSRNIDEFWHNHILHTKNYFHDCLQIFGHYLHHQPATPGENNETLIQQYLLTKQFYLEEFKQPLDIK